MDNIYKEKRKKLKLSRADVSETSFMAEKRIERIENGDIRPNPEDVITLANTYNDYDLCHQYCAKECPIGKEFATKEELKEGSLAEISMRILANINSMNNQKNKIIDTTADGQITEEEFQDFKEIYDNLEKIESNIKTLKFWLKENMDAADFLKDDKTL